MTDRVLTDKELAEAVATKSTAAEFLKDKEFMTAIRISYNTALHTQDAKTASIVRAEITEWLNGWCEHTTNPLQRRYLCQRCRQELKRGS